MLDRDLVAAALPAYELGGELGRGGWGVVLDGRHRQLGREVAIKELPRAFAADPTVRARFVSEARLLAGFDHPHIVPVYDFVEVDGLCLLVMEKLPGGTVWKRFTADGLSMDQACAITLAACAALHCAHGQGVLHRDIKPENLLFSGGRVLKVTDFGIAKVVGGSKTLATRAGEVLGTPAYMAPEQAQGKELSPATDVYATGTMLYELLSGRLPFSEEGDVLAVVFRHVYEQPAQLTDVAPQIPREVSEVVMRSIATDPAERFDSAEAFGLALAEAATAAWSPGWLGRGDLQVMSAPAIVAVTERASGPVAGRPVAPGVAVPVGPAPVTEVQNLARPSVPTALVRPSITVHRGGGRLEDIDAGDLIPVSEVLQRPPSATVPVLVSLVLVLVTVALALVGLGPPRYPPDLGPELTINGAVAGAAPLRLDLTEPVVVAGRLDDGSPSAITTGLRFSVAGVPLASVSTTAGAAPDGSFSTSLDASGLRYLVAGRATATVELRQANGAELGRRTFPVTTSQPPLLSAPGIAGIGLTLFVLAYAESLLRARRRGRKRYAAPLGMLAVGALGGVAATAAAWLLAGREPGPRTAVAGAVVGAAAGLASVVAAARSASRRRFRTRRPR